MQTSVGWVVLCDGEIKNAGSGNDREASDIMGGKYFGPASMKEGLIAH
jgi:hypothetical protein